MAKLTIAEFTAQAVSKNKESEAKRLAAQTAWQEQYQMDWECSPEGSYHILSIARIASRFDGFPTSVSLASDNGYQGGIYLKFKNGLWRIQTSQDAFSHVDRGSVAQSLSRTASKAMKSLGIKHSPDSFRSLLDISAWDPNPKTFKAQIAEISKQIPVHVLDSLLCHGCYRPDIPTELASHVDYLKFQETWIDALCAVGASVDAMPSKTVGTPLAHAAKAGNIAYIRLLHKRGADINAARGRGAEPIAMAVRKNNPDAFRLLKSLGANIRITDEIDNTLLHLAASHGAGISIVQDLIRAGLSTTALDSHGRTPQDLFEEYLEGDCRYRTLSDREIQTARSALD